MKFLIMTDSCDGIGISWSLLKEGHDVKAFIKNQYYRGTYQNIIPQVKTIQEGLTKDTVIISDMTGTGLIPEKLKAMGYLVVGAGMGLNKQGKPYNDELEENRAWAMEFIEAHGVNTSEWHKFPDYRQAIQFIKGNDQRFVCKPLGEGGTALTFPSKNNEELAAFLETKGKEGLLKEGIILQEFVEGTEVSIEVFCSGGRYVDGGLDSTLETKRFQNDNKGPNTGCQSSVCWMYQDKPKLFMESLAKVEDWIAQTKYCGFLDMNGIIDKEGNYNFLEFTPRLGYSSWYATSKCIDMDLGEFFYKMAKGELKDVKTRKGFGTAVRVCIPPYPFEPPDKPYKALNPQVAKQLEAVSKPFGGYSAMISKIAYQTSKDQTVTFNVNDDIIPLDVYYDPQKKGFLTAGTHAIIAEGLGYGGTLESACNSALEAAKSVEVANSMYRTDIYENSSKRYDELKKLGYL